MTTYRGCVCSSLPTKLETIRNELEIDSSCRNATWYLGDMSAISKEID